MKKGWFCAMGLACLMASCTGTTQSSADGLEAVVNVEGAMENLAELKLSELGQDVRYVVLETNDSCLIGRNPAIQLLDKGIIISFDSHCFLFDRQTGKFLNKIGHAGDDPEAYSNAAPTYNPLNGLLYFLRQPDKLQKYDLQGNYRGTVTMPTKPASPSDFCFTDSLIVGRYNNILKNENRSLVSFNEAGEQIDTVPGLLPPFSGGEVGDLDAVNVRKLGIASAILAQFKNGKSLASIVNVPSLWRSDDQVRYKENFNDTIYTLKGNRLTPYIAFSTGKWHWGAEARAESEGSDDRLLITYVAETEHTLFFQCIRGLHERETKVLNGIYNRAFKTTRMAAEQEGFKDDLNGFVPFHPQTYSAQGEYATLVEAGDVMTWLEENPEAAENEKLSLLKDLKEDSNPVVVITVPE